MRLEVLAGPRAVARRAAEEIAGVLRRQGRRRIVLASGKTMVAVYAELVRLHRLGRAPFRRAETFNLDELLLSPDDPRSFRVFMERHLFSRVGLPAGHIHFLRGDAADLEAECRRYERELARARPDITLVGIGDNGHVAYLEPGRSLAPVTARVRLSPSTRRGLAAKGLRPPPREALTMGIETILSARRIMLAATGPGKAAAIGRALEGRVTPSCPASFLTLHSSLTVILDRAAAKLLTLPSSRGVSK
ncbi:MAG TPA: glucosamine-6-phosphate deaminase [Thermoanaerobaculia bacterium]|nr:glucosamine-6-phosphate deaminase [Thermoanaerobaculia bacterium]